MPDTNTLGIVLGAVLGFIVGAIAVGVTFICVRKRSKSYNTHESEGHRTIEYYNSPPQSLTSHTRPVPIQPNIYKLNKQIEEPSDVEDGEERVRVTEPYDHRVMDVISEENGSEVGDDITELAETKSRDDATMPSKRKKLTRGLSLPTTIAPADLVHHSQDILAKHGDTQPCVLETSMFYDTVSKELHVTVIQVTGIPTPDESFLRPPNCSVKMRILPEMLQWQWTRKVSRTVSPVFNETFIVPGFVHNKLRECTVHFVVLDFDHVQDNVYVIGEVFMPLSELRANRLEKISKRVNPLSI